MTQQTHYMHTKAHDLRRGLTGHQAILPASGPLSEGNTVSILGFTDVGICGLYFCEQIPQFLQKFQYTILPDLPMVETTVPTKFCPDACSHSLLIVAQNRFQVFITNVMLIIEVP